MKWDDDLLLEKSARRRGTLQLAMCAAHLGTGSTLYCRQVKLGTIKKYVKDIASFLALFGDEERDYRKDNGTDTCHSKLLTSVYAELARWEKMPNRREPFTVEMLDEWRTMITKMGAPFDSLESALLDWFEIGLFAGLRLSEWAQDGASANIDRPKLDIFGDSKAFCLNDVRVRTVDGCRLRGAAILQVPCSAIRQCWIKFRTQKNGDNGEEKTFTANPRAGGRDFVRPMYNVIKRFVQLRSSVDATTPLAIYAKKDAAASIRFITAIDIEATMRAVAAKLYKLDPVKDRDALQRWSAHSLRVGACVILHSLGFTEAQIKFLLRWRSNAFMDYLRNVAILAQKQMQAIDQAGAMPHFLY